MQGNSPPSPTAPPRPRARSGPTRRRCPAKCPWPTPRAGGRAGPPAGTCGQREPGVVASCRGGTRIGPRSPPGTRGAPRALLLGRRWVRAAQKAAWRLLGNGNGTILRPRDPASGCLLEKLQTLIRKDLCSPRSRQQPKCPRKQSGSRGAARTHWGAARPEDR